MMNMRAVLKDVSVIAENKDNVFLVDACRLPTLEVAIGGPGDSPYESGLFKLKIQIPLRFPIAKPVFSFITKVFHPNIDLETGRICVDVLDEKWSPSMTLKGACQLIQELLRDPNPDSPLNTDAARMMRQDMEMFTRTAMMYSKYHANGVHSYIPYQESVEIASAVTRDIDKALQVLVNVHWDREQLEGAISLLDLD